VSLVTETTVGGHRALRLEISGTLQVEPLDEGRTKANYKMVSLHVEERGARYQIRLLGPACTVDAHLKEFDDWLRACR